MDAAGVMSVALDLPWAVSFPKSVDVNLMIDGSPAFLHHLGQGLVGVSDTRSLPVHPTQIYSMLGNISIFFIIKAFFQITAGGMGK